MNCMYLSKVFLIASLTICCSQSLLSQEKFEPIGTSNYTDTNYYKNLEKSKIQQERLSAQPIEFNKSTAEEDLKRYKLELEKYPIGSSERLIIEEKIRQTQESIEH